uniref:Uncharacterized protein n=1 Tax=Glossina pallidipes TaxID=7398 RepID=A0A1A9ZNG1_GLOPL
MERKELNCVNSSGKLMTGSGRSPKKLPLSITTSSSLRKKDNNTQIKHTRHYKRRLVPKSPKFILQKLKLATMLFFDFLKRFMNPNSHHWQQENDPTGQASNSDRQHQQVAAYGH